MLLAEDRISLSYVDMLGGTDLHLHADGFTFSPYRIMVAAAHLPFPIVIAAPTAANGTQRARS